MIEKTPTKHIVYKTTEQLLKNWNPRKNFQSWFKIPKIQFLLYLTPTENQINRKIENYKKFGQQIWFQMTSYNTFLNVKVKSFLYMKFLARFWTQIQYSDKQLETSRVIPLD